MTSTYLASQYGGAVQAEYHDMAEPGNQAAHPEVLEAAAEHDLPFPLVAVNGELRVAGSADLWRILPLVESAFAQNQAA
jgi:disulfide oxidoreductase YuzD